MSSASKFCVLFIALLSPFLTDTDSLLPKAPHLSACQSKGTKTFSLINIFVYLSSQANSNHMHQTLRLENPKKQSSTANIQVSSKTKNKRKKKEQNRENLPSYQHVEISLDGRGVLQALRESKQILFKSTQGA